MLLLKRCSNEHLFFVSSLYINTIMITKVKNDYHIKLKTVKKHLRVDENFADDDEYITDLIGAATDICENYIEKDIAYTTSTMHLRDYCGSDVIITEGNYIDLISISADTTTININECYVSKYDSHFVITLPNYLNLNDKYLTVNFHSGYQINELPKAIKSAILITIGDLYDVDRSNYTFSNYKNNAVSERLLNFYKAKYFKYIKN